MPRLRLVLALLVPVVAVLVVPGQANAALLRRYEHIHFNICGANDKPACTSNGRWTIMRDEVKAWMDAYQPDIVTLNEVCFGQFNYLATSGVPYYARFTTTLAAEPACGVSHPDTRFGNAIFIRNDPATVVYTAYEHILDPIDIETRKLTCIGATIRGGHLYVCNTHLHPDRGIAGNQIQQVATIMNGTYGPTGKGIVLAGDFNTDIRHCGVEAANLVPIYRSWYGGTTQSGCNLGNSTFSEVDRYRTGYNDGAINEATYEGTLKLDYIFFNHSHFLVDWVGDVRPEGQSDHDPLFGEYTLQQ